MPRNMSFALTTEQIRNRSKTVTRRKVTGRPKGWVSLEPGQQVWAIEKGMGLKKGEGVVRLALLEIVAVEVEPLSLLTDAGYASGYGLGEVIAEGFPDMSPAQFVQFFLDANGGTEDQDCIRIEFKYVDAA